jgi:hypothetical protein
MSQGQPGPQSEFQDSQDYTEKPSLEKKKEKKKKKKRRRRTAKKIFLLKIETLKCSRGS